MLSAADAELVARDPALPGLSLLLDPEAVAQRLAAALPDSGIRSATPTYLRYKPGTNCLVAYRLGLASGELLAYAKAHGRDAGDKLEKASVKRGVGGALGTSRVLLGELGVVFQLFPNDAKLPLLRRLDEPGELRRLLERALEDRPGLWDARVTPLRYKPERRFVGRLDAPSGERAALRVYGEDDFEAATKSAKRLRSRGRLRLAARIGASKGKHVIVTEWLPGAGLVSRLRDPALAETALAADLAKLGAALADLHGQRDAAAKLPPLEVGALGAALDAAAAQLAFLCPALAAEVTALAREIASALRLDADEPLVALHGDFHPDQVLLPNGDEIALLDLDLACRGPARADLANFEAHLLRDAVCERLPATRAERACAGLAAGYAEAAGADLGERRAWRAASLLRLAAEPFRQRDPRWPERCAAIVERARAELGSGDGPSERGRSSRAATSAASAGDASAAATRASGGARARSAAVESSALVSDPLGAARDSDLPLLPGALDAAAMQRHLGALLAPHSPAALELESISVLRHKPGRRALIEYQVVVPPPAPGAAQSRMRVLGKHRMRGLDSRTAGVMRALRERGLAGEASAVPGAPLVRVAEPLGEIPELHLWIQRREAGSPATALLALPSGAALAARIGAGLARLHAAELRSKRDHPLAQELAVLRERLEVVAAEQPAWRERSERIAAACERLAARLPDTARTGIHRDFYSDQVVVDGAALTIVDLDLFAYGDPALDAGNFLAHLTEQALREHGEPEALADREHAFREAYLSRAPSADAQSVRTYEVLSLARLLQVSRRIPERRATTEALFDWIEHRLDLSRRIRVA